MVIGVGSCGRADGGGGGGRGGRFQVGEAGAVRYGGWSGGQEANRGPLTNRARVFGGHGVKTQGEDGLLKAGYRAEAQATNSRRREEERGHDWRLSDQLRRLLVMMRGLRVVEGSSGGGGCGQNSLRR